MWENERRWRSMGARWDQARVIGVVWLRWAGVADSAELQTGGLAASLSL